MSLTLCVPATPPPPPPEYALQAAIVCVSACYPTCSSLQPYMMQVSAELGFANMLPGPLIAVAPELAKRTAPGPKPLVVHACTRRKTCLCSPGPNLNETLPRRAPAPLGVSASRPGDGGAGVCQHGQSGLARSSPCDTPPLQKPARARPLAQGHAAHPPLAFSRGALAAWMPKRGCGCGARAPAQSRRFHPPLAIQVRGVVRRACRASPRAGGVAGSRVHAQQRRSEHRVAVRSGRRVRVNQKCCVFYS